jgi:hypothetical protein
MASVRSHTFPGVYTSITDASFLTPTVSRFIAGLIGPAAKGPLSTPTAIKSLQDFRRQFGQSLGDGFYLADAAALLCDLSDGLYILRVAHEYTAVSGCSASGDVGGYRIHTAKAAAFDPSAFDADATTNVYLRISQASLPSTVNVVVSGTGTDSEGAYIDLLATGDALAADYTAANIAFSELPGAANNAESVLYGYTYSATTVGAGVLSGNKSAYELSDASGSSNWVVGGTYKITQTGKVTTEEIRVRRVILTSPILVEFETSDVAQTGYKALSLQDSYTAATAYRVVDSTTVPVLYLQAASPGTWANGEDSTTGLYVKVLPGSKAGSKKLEVYEDSSLVEAFDNLSPVSTDADYYEDAINGLSSYITVTYVGGGALPANTCDPWDATLTASTSPKAMPAGAINNGQTGGTHGSFANGYNGADLATADIVGTIDPSDEAMSGIKAFEDTDNVSVDILCAPGIENGNITVSTAQELARVANKINAVALIDVPKDLTAREAIDWHNGDGVYKNVFGKLDTRNVACFWNWWTGSDRWSASSDATKVFPPTMAAMRAQAFTFDNEKPWYAAAGEIRGIIPEALSVQFTRVSQDTKDAMYGNGQSVNPILLQRGRIMVFGERTLQRAESKLTVIHSNVLVHYIVKGLANIARRFVFDPNDVELVTQVKLAFNEFLNKVKNDRGMEAFNLVIDDTNNTADTRNRRELNVDLYLIPTDTVERIFINAIVRESGANLKSVTTQ